MQDIHMLDIKFSGSVPKDVAQQLINFHMADGLDEAQAKKAALTTFHVMLSAGVYPGVRPTIQKARNYLMKNP